MKLRNFSEAAAKYMELVGLAAVLFMLLIIGLDVIGTNVFQTPVRGGSEMVSFAQVVAVSGALAINFYFGRHISIEFVMRKLKRFHREILEKIISIVCFFFFIVLAWQGFRHGVSLYKAGEISSTAHIPLYPFAFVISVGAAIAALYFLVDILREKEETVFYVEADSKKED